MVELATPKQTKKKNSGKIKKNNHHRHSFPSSFLCPTNICKLMEGIEKAIFKMGFNIGLARLG
jgi:hypothetical protein